MYSCGTRSPRHGRSTGALAKIFEGGRGEERSGAGPRDATGPGRAKGASGQGRGTKPAAPPHRQHQARPQFLYSPPLFIQHALASPRLASLAPDTHHLPSLISPSHSQRFCVSSARTINLPNLPSPVHVPQSVSDGPVSQLAVAVLRAGAVPVVRRRGVRPGRQGVVRRRHLRLRRRGVAGRGGDGVHGGAGDGERDAARRRHRRHLRRRLLHRGRRVVTRPLALGRLRRLVPPLHGGHHLGSPERQAGPGEGGAGGSERRAESDQRHQLAVRGDERPVRDRQRQGPPRGRGAPAAGDGDRGGHRRGRGGPGAVLLGVPAGLPGGRARAEAAGVPPPLPRALHRLLARQARILPAVPARHLN